MAVKIDHPDDGAAMSDR